MKISIIIPVKNGGTFLIKCLTAIRQQSIADKIEIIVLDSISTDNSGEIAKRKGAKVINIADGSFNHGLTRNLGVQHAKGELIYFTVQDACLTEIDQLEKMVEHFIDKDVQSVTGIQGIPPDRDKNPAIWFQRFSKAVPEIRQFKAGDFNRLSPEEQLANCGWDNVNAMYRRSALQELPFKKTQLSEDALWAKDALSKGWKLIRDSSLLVYHYHHHSWSYSFRSVYLMHYSNLKNFGLSSRLPHVIKPIAQNIFTIIKRESLSTRQKTKWIAHNVSRHICVWCTTALFNLMHLIGGQKLVDTGLKIFCKTIPQGMAGKKTRLQTIYTA